MSATCNQIVNCSVPACVCGVDLRHGSSLHSQATAAAQAPASFQKWHQGGETHAGSVEERACYKIAEC
jgi:hypothetical protein